MKLDEWIQMGRFSLIDALECIQVDGWMYVRRWIDLYWCILVNNIHLIFIWYWLMVWIVDRWYWRMVLTDGMDRCYRELMGWSEGVFMIIFLNCVRVAPDHCVYMNMFCMEFINPSYIMNRRRHTSRHIQSSYSSQERIKSSLYISFIKSTVIFSKSFTSNIDWLLHPLPIMICR